MEIIFMDENPHKEVIVKMLNEGLVDSNYDIVNYDASLRALGSVIERIEIDGKLRKIYIKNIKNLLLG